MKKTKILETVNHFPKKFGSDELLDRLIFIDKVEKGLKEVEKGQTLKHSEVELYFKNKLLK